jgi:hypothetical protein
VSGVRYHEGNLEKSSLISPQSVSKVAVTDVHGTEFWFVADTRHCHNFFVEVDQLASGRSADLQTIGQYFSNEPSKRDSVNPSISSRTEVPVRLEAVGIAGLPTTARSPPQDSSDGASRSFLAP